jgi:hypothetical protein
MLAAIFRLFVVVLLLAGLAVLFFYAFVAALILTPILFVLFWLLGRKANIQWTVVRPGDFARRPPGRGPVIDHDPDDLPPPADKP